MKKRCISLLMVFVFALFTYFTAGSVVVSASTMLKKGTKGKQVTELQGNLKKLGFFSGNPTGYYGDATVASVKKLQKSCKLKQDGVAGSDTLTAVNNLLKRSKPAVSRASINRQSYLVSWFDGVENIFKKGDVATVYDIDTGLSFKAKRTYGYNHADCEPLTASDTKIMKKIYGGEWSWERRAVIVTVNGRTLAGSMTGMPHAGNEGVAGEAYVNWRSGGYGSGYNLDDVKNNGMNGHFDIHFYGSKTHGTDRVDKNHQNMVMSANDWAKKNF